MTTYRIRDWPKHFEIAQSRKAPNKLSWVALPNKHDGKGFRKLAAHKDAVAIFCAWCLIVQVASKMKERGTLADDDGPLDSEDLSLKTGYPQEIFDQAFEVLCQEKIAWLEIVNGEL